MASMKLMKPEVYQAYSRILKRLRSGGRTLDLFTMQLACDYVLALEAGNEAEAREIGERLGLDLEAADGLD